MCVRKPVKPPIETGFQVHFHKWMNELKYLDTPKITEEQGINLVLKHFLLAIQAFIENGSEKKFLNIWEKLDEMEIHQIGKTHEATAFNRNPEQKYRFPQNRTNSNFQRRTTPNQMGVRQLEVEFDQEEEAGDDITKNETNSSKNISSITAKDLVNEERKFGGKKHTKRMPVRK